MIGTRSCPDNNGNRLGVLDHARDTEWLSRVRR
jgi:hypothetical protein